MPLHHDIINAFVPLLDREHEQYEGVVAQYRHLLALVGAIQRGEVSVNDVVISDDGWQIMPPEPEDDDGSSPA